MPRLSKNPRSQGVDPSPTPMIGTVGDSRTVISTRSINDRAKISAVIHPADPPPTITTRRTGTGPRPASLPGSGPYDPLKSVAVVTSFSELGPHVEVVLRTVLIERTRLILVECVVLEGRLVEILAVERERDHVVEGVLQGSGQAADTILREGGLAIETAEERGSIRVRDTRAERVVLIIPTEVVGIFRCTHEAAVAVGHLRSLLAVSVGIVGTDTKVIEQRLLVGKLRAPHPSLRVDRHSEQVRHLRALRYRTAESQVGLGVRAVTDVVSQVHVEQAGRQHRAFREVPF